MNVSSDIAMDGLSKGIVYPWVCNLRVKVNLILCVQCGRLIHGKCAEVKWVSPEF